MIFNKYSIERLRHQACIFGYMPCIFGYMRCIFGYMRVNTVRHCVAHCNFRGEQGARVLIFFESLQGHAQDSGRLKSPCKHHKHVDKMNPPTK